MSQRTQNLAVWPLKLGTLASLVLLVACQTTTPEVQPGTTTPPPGDTETQLPEIMLEPTLAPENIEKLAQADALARTGYYGRAADLYAELAFATDNPQRQAEWLVRSAGLYQQAGQADEVLALFATLEPDMLNSEQMQAMQIYVSAAQLQKKAYYKSLVTLPKLDTIADPKLKNQAIEIRARGLLAIGNPLAALQLSIDNEPKLSEAEAIDRNQTFIWSALKRLTDKNILELLKEPQTLGLRGWLELELIARRSGMLPEQMAPWIELWMERYAAHPAADQFAENLLEESRALYIQPSHIAVLLPHGGALAKVAEAVRNGIIYAHYKTNGASPDTAEIEFVDSQLLNEDPQLLYNDLAQQGVDLVIGPLDKNLLQKLVDEPELGILTLALNRVDDQIRAPSNLFQFGLSPEDEARQAAIFALRDQHHFALALTPRNRWGERMATAFKQDFEKLGGRLLNAEGFESNSNDHAQAIKKLLDISASDSRRAILQRIIGREVEFQPRRRQDADSIFLAANKSQALQIKPQLKFYRAGDLPVYATSHLSINSAVPGSSDRDLDGIRFVDMPWALDSDELKEHSDILRLWPRQSRQYSRLFALGIDSYRVAAALRRLQRDPDQRQKGLTGNLAVNQQGFVVRELELAQIVRGKARKLQQPQAAAN